MFFSVLLMITMSAIAATESASTSASTSASMRLENTDGMSFLKTVDAGSVDLILTDPPYIISKTSGMDKHHQLVQEVDGGGGGGGAGGGVKTEAEWLVYKESHGLEDDSKKTNYMRYGTVYGKKNAVKTNFGIWDNEFTMEVLDAFIAEYYKKLRTGGTLIMFFDLWKIGDLKAIMEKHKFKQIRFIEWIKTNPQPRNSSVNYLTNCREIAVMGVKGGKPTFNSKYDNGIYSYPLQGGKGRFHPTQKNLLMFQDLLLKHSNEGDVVLDTFLGAGTTALACGKTGRLCLGCELSKEYYDKMMANMV